MRGWVFGKDRLVFLSTIGCVPQNTWVPLDKVQLDTKTRANTTATLYELNYGQVRYMNLAAVIVGAVANMGGQIAKQTNINGGTRVTQDLKTFVDNLSVANAREDSSDFEKKMGDFDVFAFFADQFNARRSDLRYFNIEVAHDEVEHGNIINRLTTYDATRLDKAYGERLLQSGTKYLSAFKFQYGIGARAGGEQFGFTKKYRAYVRIVGLVKDVGTNRFVWGNKITLFSNEAFHGTDKAQNASRDQLIEQFKLITGQLADIVVRDLNGDRYTSEEFLVDYDPNVDDVLSLK
jgi:hypothetical protein